MRKILLSEDAFEDLNVGFLFYEAQESGLGDYFTSCLRSDIESLKFTAGIHRNSEGFHRLLSRAFPYGIFYTLESDTVIVWAVTDLRRDPNWIASKLKK